MPFYSTPPGIQKSLAPLSLPDGIRKLNCYGLFISILNNSYFSHPPNGIPSANSINVTFPSAIYRIASISSLVMTNYPDGSPIFS